MTVFYPTDLNIVDFYMSYDIKLFIDTVRVGDVCVCVCVSVCVRVCECVSGLFSVHPSVLEQLLEHEWSSNCHHFAAGKPLQVNTCDHLRSLAITCDHL